MEENKENLQSCSGTRIYKTLKEFKDLRMSKEQLYYRLIHYVLDQQQLAKNKFPLPGMASSEAFSQEGLVRRKCNRCNKMFQVSLKGIYEKMEECMYHLDRFKFIGGYTTEVTTHKCCSKPYGSIGCQSHHGHVCAEPILHNVTFKNVREKRQVRAEHSCAIYALDCEMVYTSVGFQVAKIGIVNLEGLTIYESYVLPDNEIIDYNTAYSGIGPKDLKGVTTTLSDVQIFLDHILNQDSILVGHGLENDLKVLRLMHYKIIDTAVIFPREDGTKRKLKELALEYLNQNIQDDPSGHDCIEDARTCMALMLYKIKQDQAATQDNRNRYLLNRYNIQASQNYQFEVPHFSYGAYRGIDFRRVPDYETCLNSWHKNQRQLRAYLQA